MVRSSRRWYNDPWQDADTDKSKRKKFWGFLRCSQEPKPENKCTDKIFMIDERDLEMECADELFMAVDDQNEKMRCAEEIFIVDERDAEEEHYSDFHDTCTYLDEAEARTDAHGIACCAAPTSNLRKTPKGSTMNPTIACQTACAPSFTNGDKSTHGRDEDTFEFFFGLLETALCGSGPNPKNKRNIKSLPKEKLPSYTCVRNNSLVESVGSSTRHSLDHRYRSSSSSSSSHLSSLGRSISSRSKSNHVRKHLKVHRRAKIKTNDKVAASAAAFIRKHVDEKEVYSIPKQMSDEKEFLLQLQHDLSPPPLKNLENGSGSLMSPTIEEAESMIPFSLKALHLEKEFHSSKSMEDELSHHLPLALKALELESGSEPKPSEMIERTSPVTTLLQSNALDQELKPNHKPRSFILKIPPRTKSPAQEIKPYRSKTIEQTASKVHNSNTTVTTAISSQAETISGMRELCIMSGSDVSSFDQEWESSDKSIAQPANKTNLGFLAAFLSTLMAKVDIKKNALVPVTKIACVITCVFIILFWPESQEQQRKKVEKKDPPKKPSLLTLIKRKEEERKEAERRAEERKVEERKEAETKEATVKETEAKETKANEEEMKETKAKEADMKESKAKEPEPKDGVQRTELRDENDNPDNEPSRVPSHASSSDHQKEVLV